METRNLFGVDLFDISSVEKHLPKGYRIYTYYPKWTGPEEIVIIRFNETTVLQHREYEDAKFLGIFPYKRRKWVNIGEFQPSWLGLTQLPMLGIYAGYVDHLNILKEALKEHYLRSILIVMLPFKHIRFAEYLGIKTETLLFVAKT